MWTKLSKGTFKRQDLSYYPICRSLRPFVKRKQPGKARVEKNRCLRTFWPNSAISDGRFWQKQSKVHLNAKTFHMTLFAGLYDHPLQRNGREKLMFRKTVVFGHFGQIRPFPVADFGQNCHIYMPRPFIWAYSEVSTTSRYKDTTWKESMTDRRTDTPNL